MIGFVNGNSKPPRSNNGGLVTLVGGLATCLLLVKTSVFPMFDTSSGRFAVRYRAADKLPTNEEVKNKAKYFGCLYVNGKNLPSASASQYKRLDKALVKATLREDALEHRRADTVRKRYSSPSAIYFGEIYETDFTNTKPVCPGGQGGTSPSGVLVDAFDIATY
jgi:hypothetical protein